MIQYLASLIRSRLLAIADRRKPDFIIGDDYLHRWWVIPRNRFFNVYLHHFMHSDDERALHDHMYWNVSILVAGRYTEHTINAGGVNVRTEYAAGDIKFRGPKYAHRVELTHGDCWSLFITGPRVREWGFHCPHGWRHWKEFTDPNDVGKTGKGCE